MHSKKKTLLPFRPDTYVLGLYRVPLTPDERKKILGAVRDAKKRIRADETDRFIAGIEFAISVYRGEAVAAKHWRKATARGKLTKLRDMTQQLFEALSTLDEPTRCLITAATDGRRDTVTVSEWLAHDSKRLARDVGIVTARMHKHPPRQFVVTSLRRAHLELCGFSNVVSAAIAQVNEWPDGAPPNYARRSLAHLTAKALRDSGINPTLARQGTFARTLRAVMDIAGPELESRSVKNTTFNNSDVMALMKHGLRILKSESSTGESDLA